MELNGGAPIFRQIADFYARLIDLGVLEAGTYLPSVREVAVSNRVNPNTVARAYGLLVKAKLVTAIPKKGYCINGTAKKDEADDTIRACLTGLLAQGHTLTAIARVLSRLEKEQCK